MKKGQYIILDFSTNNFEVGDDTSYTTLSIDTIPSNIGVVNGDTYTHLDGDTHLTFDFGGNILNLSVGGDSFQSNQGSVNSSVSTDKKFLTVRVNTNIQAYSISGLSFSYLPPVVVPSALPSLNGNGSEFVDGTKVTVEGRGIVYTVERSYMTLYQDNSYTAHYDVVSDNGAKVSCPEALLTIVTTP